MDVHVGLARDNFEYPVILSDDERRALYLQQVKASLDSEDLGNAPAHVGEQGVVEVVGGGELGLLLDTVHGDADSLSALRGELAGEVAKVTRLPGTASCHRRWIEEQHDRTLLEKRIQGAWLTLLVVQGEIEDEVAFSHSSRLGVETESHATNSDQMSRT